jgi:hypothetical protein
MGTVEFSLKARAVLFVGILSLAIAAFADAPPQASVDGKYSELIQVIDCPEHVKTWGEFKDYGHWGGGAWCGHTGKAGYWVWVNPNWYVWSHLK